MAGHPQRSQTERLVVGITGRIGSGKTTIGKYLESKHIFQYIRYSEVLADWQLSDPQSKGQLQAIGWDVMAGGLQSELSRRLIAQIGAGDTAVDGLRHTIDYDSLNGAFSSTFHLLYVDSSPEHCWNHVKGKGRYLRRDIFDAADSHPVEQQIVSLRTKANLVIRNEASLKDLYDQVDRAILSFRKAGYK